MKNIKFLAIAFLIIVASCSKSDDDTVPVVVIDPNAPSVAAANVVTEPSAVSGVSYKAYLQKPATATNRKGLIILTHGDGSNVNDGILNDQCIALANEGYVAVTITYRPLVLDYAGNYNSFKTDMQNAVTWLNAEYNIPVNKTMLGVFSRGGNLAFKMFLPADVGAAIQPTDLNLKAAILMCAGGNNWQGRAILKPVIFMANKVDAAVQIIDAVTFKAG